MNPPVRIGFFRKEGGRIPLLLWLKSLPAIEREDIGDLIDRLEREGNELSAPATAALAGYPNLFELRSRVGRVRLRVFFCWLPNGVAVLLDGLRKTDAGEQQRALSRMEGYAQLAKANPVRHVIYDLAPRGN